MSRDRQRANRRAGAVPVRAAPLRVEPVSYRNGPVRPCGFCGVLCLKSFANARGGSCPACDAKCRACMAEPHLPGESFGVVCAERDMIPYIEFAHGPSATGWRWPGGEAARVAFDRANTARGAKRVAELRVKVAAAKLAASALALVAQDKAVSR